MNYLEQLGSVFVDVDLTNYNTYKIKSSCKYMFLPNDVDGLISSIKYLDDNNIKYFILGNGSNVILPSKLFNGVIIKLDKFNLIKYLDNNEVLVEAGVMMPRLGIDSINNGYKGLEWCIGIPGTFGGCIYNNAGAYKSSINDLIKSVTFIDDKYNIVTLDKESLCFGYRDSLFKKYKNYIIISAIIKLEKGNKEESLDLVEDRKKRRNESQPLSFPSAGSVFRNPDGMYAGKLIEDINYKGIGINGAVVSEKHANFIINTGGATGEDIVKLINNIKIEVKNNCGVDLIQEQEIIDWE